MNKQEAKDKKEYLEMNKKFSAECFDKQIAELQSIIDAPESGWFVPKEGQWYWCLTPSGNIGKYFHDSDSRILAYNIVREVKEEIIRDRKKSEATIKYLKEIARLNKGWKPDWSNGEERKYLAEYDHKEKRAVVIYYYATKHKDNDWYSLSESAAKEAVSILTETEIELIFRS